MKALPICAIALLIGFIDPRDANAEGATDVAAIAPTSLTLVAGSGAFKIPTHQDVEIRIKFLHDIREISSPDTDPRIKRPKPTRFSVDRTFDELKIRMKERPKGKKLETLNLVVTTGKERVSLKLHEAETSDELPTQYETRLKAGDDEIRRQEQREAILADLTVVIDNRMAHLEGAAIRAWSNSTVRVPAAKRSIGNDCMKPEISHAGSQGELTIVAFQLYNPGAATCRVTGVEVRDTHGQSRETGRLFTEGARSTDHWTLVEVPPGRHISGAIPIHGGNRDLDTMSITFYAANHPEPAAAIVDSWKHPIPLAATVNDLRSDDPAVNRSQNTPPARSAGMLVFDVGVRGGSIWLGRDAGGDLLTPASLIGVGVRAAYSFDQHFGFETELFGASSGDAQFQGHAQGELQGHQIRRTQLGRLQFNGVLRLGEQVVPTVRLGVGVQGMAYDSVLVSDQGLTTDLAQPFEVDMITSVGAGVHVRLGRRWLVGVEFSYVDRVNSGERLIDGGFHLGYVPE